MKTCLKCQSIFNFAETDSQFLQKVNPEYDKTKYFIPDPKFCPDCRQQRRLTWRNERNLYQRTCDLCHKKSLSIYRKDKPFPVYCLDCWWGDKWNPKNYGKEYDFTCSFFEQFKELHNLVPKMMVQQSQNENSEYTANVSHLKNCYLLFSSDFNKDCYYGVWIENCQDCIDDLIINKSQLAYEAIFSDNVYNCTFVIHSSQCSDSAFLVDCRNCSNCFMSFGLRNKQYYIANKSYSKEEYFKKIRALPLSSNRNYQSFKQQFIAMMKDMPFLFMWRNGSVMESSGDFLTDVKNCQECYEIIEGRDCKYVQGGYQITDAQDCSYVHGELGYENCECFPMPTRSAFNMNSYTGNDIFYSDMCMNNSYLFGCIGLKRSSHCILNKQYRPEEYNRLVPKIIEHMQKTAEWGDFFPSAISPFYYNESNAQDFFPLKKEEAIAQEFTWLEKEKKDYQPQTYVIPDDINNTPKDILDYILSCVECGKNYKIISQEYTLLQKLQLPIPRLCFECRHQQRCQFRKKRKLYLRKCFKCATAIQTNFSPKNSEKVYCETCYLQELN